MSLTYLLLDAFVQTWLSSRAGGGQVGSLKDCGHVTMKREMSLQLSFDSGWGGVTQRLAFSLRFDPLGLPGTLHQILYTSSFSSSAELCAPSFP